MKQLALLPCALLALTSGCHLGPSSHVEENFDAVEVGAIPAGWQSTITGQGAQHWAVIVDPTAPSAPNVIEQSGRAVSHGYPLCVKTNIQLLNGFVETQFKPIAGQEDQAGGVVWRWQNASNYYIARGNALETNVIFFRMVGGVRSEVHRVPVPIAANQWHSLRVDFHEDRAVIHCDGREVMDWSDSSLMQPGAAGLWTKADSVTRFDNFRCGQ